MEELGLFLNKRNSRIRQAVLYIGQEYEEQRLRELLKDTSLDRLILTGEISPEQAQALMEPLLTAAAKGQQRLPASFVFCAPEELVRPEGEYALICEGVGQNRSILPLAAYTPEYLLGRIKEDTVSSFDIWEAYRGICRHILLVTQRDEEDDQVMDWEKDLHNAVELSVILPMYNVEKYLDQCIQSVTAWPADYVEFLFVNDGSPDGSGALVEKYARKDRRIRLLNKENGGCASARQWGLDHARGRYVGFVDPDDYVDETMFRKLLAAAMTGSYDISYCGYKEHYEDTGEEKEAADVLHLPYTVGTTDPQRLWELVAYCRVAIWRGIYKMDMLRKNRIHFYTELRRFDDLPFKVETFAAAQSVIAVEEYLYYYRLARPGQDVAADDQRLYVHFPIFAHLNDSVAGRGITCLTDCLQMCKIQTHRFAVGKIKEEFLKEYIEQAIADLATTGKRWRTFFVAKQMIGKKAAMIYWAIMHRHYKLLKKLCKQ